MGINLKIQKSGKREEVFQLLSKCFPEYWAPKVANGEAYFSFPVISVIAESDNKVSGHCGIFIYEFYLNNTLHKAAGLCAVAVDPECQGMGIAGKMCDKVIEYCREKEIFFSPLYTGVPKVYEKRGWRSYNLPSPQEISVDKLEAVDNYTVYKSAELNEKQKSLINLFYSDGLNFDGKVKRSALKWDSLFSSESNFWLVTENAYALLINDGENYILAEAYGKNAFGAAIVMNLLKFSQNKLLLLLPPEHDLFSNITDNCVLASSDVDIWHGETAMTNIIIEETAQDTGLARAIKENSFFFPLPDKF
jgi:predicted acetyltransferase